MPELLTLREAAKVLGVSVRRLAEARDSGELDVIEIGKRWQRVTREDLLAWIESRRRSNEPQPDATGSLNPD